MNRLTGRELRERLHELVAGHRVVAFDSHANADFMATAHLVPVGTPGIPMMAGLYADAQLPLTPPPGASQLWDREHLWPQYRMPETIDGLKRIPRADLHAIFAAESSLNRSRGDKYFGWCPWFCDRVIYTPTGPSGTPTATPIVTLNFDNAAMWRVRPERRGDVARALFYMDVRYEGCAASDGSPCNEPNLALVNGANLGDHPGVMGDRDTLRTWATMDPPGATSTEGALEHQHHQAAFAAQGNRNPFIDHPEWIDAIYGEIEDVYLPFVASGAEVGGAPDSPESIVPGPLQIEFVYYDGREPSDEGDEFVILRHVGLSPANRQTPAPTIPAGWILGDDDGNEVTLDALGIHPGQSCRVFTDVKATPTPGGYPEREEFGPLPPWCGSFGSGAAIWNNKDDGDCAELRWPTDAPEHLRGPLADRYCYEP